MITSVHWTNSTMHPPSHCALEWSGCVPQRYRSETPLLTLLRIRALILSHPLSLSHTYTRFSEIASRLPPIAANINYGQSSGNSCSSRFRASRSSRVCTLTLNFSRFLFHRLFHPIERMYLWHVVWKLFSSSYAFISCKFVKLVKWVINLCSLEIYTIHCWEI